MEKHVFTVPKHEGTREAEPSTPPNITTSFQNLRNKMNPTSGSSPIPRVISTVALVFVCPRYGNTLVLRIDSVISKFYFHTINLKECFPGLKNCLPYHLIFLFFLLFYFLYHMQILFRSSRESQNNGTELSPWVVSSQQDFVDV